MNAKIPTVCKVLALLGFFCGAALAQDDLPDRTDDGLERVESDKVQVLYWLPGATLEPYRRIALLDCFVAFRKDWERDFNRDRRGVSGRVGADDMERIKKRLADLFREVFERELVDADAAAEDVLLLRPAIVNLDEQRIPAIAPPKAQTSTSNPIRIGLIVATP